MNTTASCHDRRLLEKLLGGLAAVPVGLALLIVNSVLIDLEVGVEDCESHSGWPTTYVITRYYPPWRETLLFSSPRLGVNVVCSILMLYATYVVCGRAVTNMAKGQFSLKTVLLGVTLASFAAFLSFHYANSQLLIGYERVGYERGHPYLPLSGLYRWFGPGSPYEWLFHFDLMIRIPVVAGWFCSVWFACSSCLPLLGKNRSPTRPTVQEGECGMQGG